MRIRRMIELIVIALPATAYACSTSPTAGAPGAPADGAPDGETGGTSLADSSSTEADAVSLDGDTASSDASAGDTDAAPWPGPWDSAGWAEACVDGDPIIELGPVTTPDPLDAASVIHRTYCERHPCGLGGDAASDAYVPTSDPACAALCERGEVSVPSWGHCGNVRCSLDSELRTACCSAQWMSYPCTGGRRPASLAAVGAREHGPLGFYATMAALEAASVEAFRTLRRELADHGAPKRLLRRCSRSRREEIRHARVVSRLARRLGAGEADVTRLGPTAPRSLEAIAVENAVEGCVRETWGALVAAVQVRSSDPRIAGAMRKIFRDEARHAQLAWDVARWIDPRLSPASRKKVSDARSRAVATLWDEILRVSPTENSAIGVPDARVMFEMLCQKLWMAARAPHQEARRRCDLPSC